MLKKEKTYFGATVGAFLLTAIACAKTEPVADEETQTQILTASCTKAGRTTEECDCFNTVLVRETTAEELAFIAGFMKRQQDAEGDPTAGAALVADVSANREYYRDRLEPLNKAAEIAMSECAASNDAAKDGR